MSWRRFWLFSCSSGCPRSTCSHTALRPKLPKYLFHPEMVLEMSIVVKDPEAGLSTPMLSSLAGTK